jgi:hypothetical protein
MLGEAPDILAGCAIGALSHPDCDAAAMFHLALCSRARRGAPRRVAVAQKDGAAVWDARSASILQIIDVDPRGYYRRDISRCPHRHCVLSSAGVT